MAKRSVSNVVDTFFTRFSIFFFLARIQNTKLHELAVEKLVK